MSSNDRRKVVSTKDGGWDIKKADAKRVSDYADTQAQAIARAKRSSTRLVVARSRFTDATVKIRGSDMVKPGNTPTPPRDNR